MADSVAMNGPSSIIAACMEPQPAAWLLAIKRVPCRSARPCVSPTVQTGFLGEIIWLPLGFGPKHTPVQCPDQVPPDKVPPDKGSDPSSRVQGTRGLTPCPRS